MAPRSVSRRPLSVKQHHQTYGLIVVPTVDRCNCDNRCRDCCIFNCSALVSACTFICFALSFAAFAFAFIRSTRFSAAPLCLISSSVIQAPVCTCCIYRMLIPTALRLIYARFSIRVRKVCVNFPSDRLTGYTIQEGSNDGKLGHYSG